MLVVNNELIIMPGLCFVSFFLSFFLFSVFLEVLHLWKIQLTKACKLALFFMDRTTTALELNLKHMWLLLGPLIPTELLL